MFNDEFNKGKKKEQFIKPYIHLVKYENSNEHIGIFCAPYKYFVRRDFSPSAVDYFMGRKLPMEIRKRIIDNKTAVDQMQKFLCKITYGNRTDS